MKAILTILTIISISVAVQAQAAYQGGSGDGYAMGELELRQVSVDELESNIKVYPTLLNSGDNIRIELTDNETLTLELTDLNGRSVMQQHIAGSGMLNTSQLSAGTYLLYTQQRKGKAIRITILQ